MDFFSSTQEWRYTRQNHFNFLSWCLFWLDNVHLLKRASLPRNWKPLNFSVRVMCNQSLTCLK